MKKSSAQSILTLGATTLLVLSVGCKSSYNRGFVDGQIVGYEEGYDDGNIDGYQRGYADGDLDGFDRGFSQAEIYFASADYNLGFSDGFSQGSTSGYNQGLSVGQSNGYNQGYNAGQSVGFNSGLNQGISQGYNNGYYDGYDDGYDDGFYDGVDAGGFNEGYLLGYEDGYYDGWIDGDLFGYQDGVNIGYDMGFDDGYSWGFNDGYDIGFDDGWDAAFGFSDRSLAVGKVSNQAGLGRMVALVHNDMIDYSKISTPKVTRQGVVANGRMLFQTSGQVSKDLEKRAAAVENYLVLEMAKQVNIKFSLSMDRSLKIAKASNHFRKFAHAKAITAKDANVYTKEIVGADFSQIQSAYVAVTQGQTLPLDQVLQQAAIQNGTSPERMSSIMAELFL